MTKREIWKKTISSTEITVTKRLQNIDTKEEKKKNIMRNCMLHGHGRCHELTMPASMISHKKQIATEIFGG